MATPLIAAGVAVAVAYQIMFARPRPRYRFFEGFLLLWRAWLEREAAPSV